MISLFLAALACAGGPASGEVPQAAPPLVAGQAEAIFAAGCFWCSESDFEKVPGVIEVVSGYAGGRVENPKYAAVGTGATGHTEAVRVVYDPKKVTYDKLLDHFWHHVDPTDGSGQFCDRGNQYRPAIFPLDDAQRKAAEASIPVVAAQLGKPVAVKLETVGTFWVAEAYHQDFYKTNPAHYQRYRTGCGRDAKVDALWSGAVAR
ncbi:MAG: peptide-methionine (S)-S-oxide reductase MsrA [Deltaproteobacteria bacterium]|nr:peptide-methionine (S)-S-oxide reductase MsrA [Deltaproteobacteria bacterium]